jgi:hypothetical protein
MHNTLHLFMIMLVAPGILVPFSLNTSWGMKELKSLRMYAWGSARVWVQAYISHVKLNN